MLGIEHILIGFDHLLFVFARVLLVKRARRLIATITAFTVAHSLTLFASTLSWIHVPGSSVEAIIALSIPMALRFFNVGVEIGQLIFMTAVLPVMAAGRAIAGRLKFSPPPWL